MDQSARYADLSLKEEDLIKGDNHILVAYHMRTRPLATATWGNCGSHRGRVLDRHQRRGLHHR